MKISVIVPARNAEATLSSTLTAIKASVIPVFEIIVVNDASSDNTLKIAQDFGVTVYSNCEQIGAGYCRNFGARKATGDAFAFIDSDVIPPPDFVKIFLEEFALGAGAVGGRYSVQGTPAERINHLAFLQEEIFWKSVGHKAEVETLYGGICAFTREAWNSPDRSFKEVKLFPAMASGEDCFVCEEIRLKHRIIYRADLVGVHLTDMSKRLFHRARNQGFSRMTIILERRFQGAPSAVMDTYRIRPLLLTYIFFVVTFFSAIMHSSLWSLPLVAGLYFFTYSVWPFIKSVPKNSDLGIAMKVLLCQQAGWVIGVLNAFAKKFDQALSPTLALARSGMSFLAGREPSKLFFFVTNRCNFKCSWCLDLNRGDGNLGAASANELTANEVEEIAKNSKYRIAYLTITGGEPFLRQDLDKIVVAFYRHAATRFVTICTNGSFPERVYEQMERVLILCPRLKLNIQLSASDVAEAHDSIRQFKGSYTRLQECAAKIRKLQSVFSNLIFSVATQLGDENADRYSEISVKIKTELQPDEHFLTLLRDSSRMITPPSAALNLIPQFVKKIEELYPGTSLFQRFYNQVVQKSITEMARIRHGKAKYQPCSAGQKFLTLYENGNALVCENRQDLPHTNVRDSGLNLRKAVESPAFQKACQKQIEEKCFCDWGCAVTHRLMENPGFVAKSAISAARTSLKIKSLRSSDVQTQRSHSH